LNSLSVISYENGDSNLKAKFETIMESSVAKLLSEIVQLTSSERIVANKLNNAPVDTPF
jgi:hypothetical protein